MSKLHESIKREHPALQKNIKFLNYFNIYIFALLDPYPDSESGSTDLTKSGSNLYPGPKH
jgi:hypothetical protein